MGEIIGMKEYEEELKNKKIVNKTAFKPNNVKDSDDTKDSEKDNLFYINEDDPLSDKNINTIEKLMKQMKNMLEILYDIWNKTKTTWQLTNTQMMKLHEYNLSHIIIPDNSEDCEYDQYNGVDNISFDDIKSIFGQNHPITKISNNAERKNVVKECIQDCFNYINILQEYNQTDIAYRKLLELREDQEISKLIAIANNEPDPDKKSLLIKSIDQYNSIKHMDYLKDPLSDNEKSIFINAFGDKDKINYWIKRSITKLEQLNIDKKFILSISGLEKIHLPERYHLLSNMTLLYFMRSIIFSDTANNNSNKTDRSKIIAMINALDAVIRNSSTLEHKTRVIDNIMAFLDQLIEPVYKKYYPDKTIIDLPISNNNEEE